jgi:hypothetical protein
MRKYEVAGQLRERERERRRTQRRGAAVSERNLPFSPSKVTAFTTHTCY